MENQEKYNPSSVGVKDSLFGLPFSEENGKIMILPIPWEITASAGNGSSKAPKAIYDESPQIDLEIRGVKNAWKCGVYMENIDEDWLEQNDAWRKYTRPYIDWLEEGSKKSLSVSTENLLEGVNGICEKLQQWIFDESFAAINKGKIVGLLGGEHSITLGLIKALSKKNVDFGILQIDAHADLRHRYEGFEHSHASVMYNSLQIPNVTKLVQVGIRDYAEEELLQMKASKGRVVTFFDKDLKEQQFEGQTWAQQCDQIISELPQQVYISFDIDGLMPSLCPNTGTPVPGGLSYEQAQYLINKVVKSGRVIIGFDLVEVVPDKLKRIDAIVGARVLYNLSVHTAVSHKIISFEV